MVIGACSDLKYLEAAFIMKRHQINVTFDHRFCHSFTSLYTLLVDHIVFTFQRLDGTLNKSHTIYKF